MRDNLRVAVIVLALLTAVGGINDFIQSTQIDDLQIQVELQTDRIDQLEREQLAPIPATVTIERPVCTAMDHILDVNGCS